MRNRSVPAALSFAAAAVLALTAAAVPAAATPPAAGGPAAGTAASPGAHCPQLSGKLHWYGDNRARLQRTIDERGRCRTPHPGPEGRPVAAFDWDNTVVKNDTTDATLAWALKHDKILRPASWSRTSKWLTPAADRALTEACGTSVPAGRPLRTSTNTRCTDEIFEIRAEAKTMSGRAAFAGAWNHRRTVPQYAWVPQLFAGRTPAQLTGYAKQARDEALAAPVGSKQTVGTHTIPGYIRYYPQQKDLIQTLRRAGFNVYIVSAGAEPVTDAWAGGVGVDSAHTIAIRSVLRHGRITTGTEGCGDTPAGQGEAIPYIDGKRCWINQDIYGVKGAAAWHRQRPAHRIALGGGDANTDVTFVGDATGAHLVLNRNQDEVMCRAYDDADGRWVINPMFIEPLPRRSTAYPCSTSGYTNPDGSLGPVLRQDGSVVPDQSDHVHGG
ncbi:haloacid dehalogenase-like hydrolase [Streptomyces sp. H27-D2]|uniref:haloacid dehalogenase-like hydrolase n=1 Tax=Streptomyces sp. H27-D2 TaxID=3046304 RepID=UPI002DBA5515|nr:haloacid dehalogenase-like hydrolase [Streptomyces sp. H27-D2]MEC4018658.1 haloacid dehalogenase-like hydrolase [Streptomyces sp. H27-D2]